MKNIFIIYMYVSFIYNFIYNYTDQKKEEYLLHTCKFGEKRSYKILMIPVFFITDTTVKFLTQIKVSNNLHIGD